MDTQLIKGVSLPDAAIRLRREPRRDDAKQHCAHTRAQSEPKASGVARIINTPPPYIG
jgi:hypothetical protein